MISLPSLTLVHFANGVSFELLTDAGEFLGIGAVHAQGVALRDGTRPWSFEIRSPDGIELSHFRIVTERVTPTSFTLELEPQRRAAGPMEWLVHEVRARHNTAAWEKPATPARDTRITLRLQPAERRFGDVTYQGLSYELEYRSSSIPIYRILDHGTWEPGGSAAGNQFWMRNCFVPPIATFGEGGPAYSTEWYLPDAGNPNVFQFLPLQTELQGFSFTAGERGTLVTWPTRVAHVRSLFQKTEGGHCIEHWHEHCGDLAYEFKTAPMEVLFAPGTTTAAARANAWVAVRTAVTEELHRQIGMEEERVAPYGQIEEWGPADLDWYMNGLEKLLEAGCDVIYIANHFQNNMNTWGISNMCCTVDYKVAESIGEVRLRRFTERARSAGARVEMWGNTALATTTLMFANREADHATGRIGFLAHEGSIMEVLEEAAAPFVRNASYAIEADHYTPVFAALNLRDKVVRDYWLRSWLAAHDDWGLEGIFLDSSFNLSSDKFHYEPNTMAQRTGATADQTHLLGQSRPAAAPPQAILSQYHAHLDLMVELQRGGIRYCNEDLGVFGVHRHGPGVQARLDNLILWAECICNFDAGQVRRAGAMPDEVYFKGLACRMMWALHWDIRKDALSFRYEGIASDDDIPTEWHLQLLRAFGAANRHMRVPQVLDGETGIMYREDDVVTLWSFEPQELPLGSSCTVRDLLTGVEATAESIEAGRLGVYMAWPVATPGSVATHGPVATPGRVATPAPSASVTIAA